MRLFRSGIILTALAITACGGGGGTTVTPPPPPPPPSTVDRVVIDNGNFAMVVGETRQLQTRPLTLAGDLVPTAVVFYASSAETVATVNASTGLVTGVSPGVTTITATTSGKSASITVTVALTPVATFSIVLTRQTIKVNDTTRVVATLRDADNTILTGRTITWTSSDQTVVLVGPTGIIFGLRPGGPVTITGSVEGKTNSVTVVVTPAIVASVKILPDSATIAPGDSVQFLVEVKDEFGGIVENPQVIWGSVGAQVASVSATGLVTAVQLGDVLILATVNGTTGQSLVHVSFPQTEKFRLSVDNKLIFPVNVTQNDVIIGRAEPNSITAIERPVTERAVFGYVLVQPGGLGEPIVDVIPEILNPTGTINMSVTNVTSDGRVFFTPVLRSVNGGKNPIDFPATVNAAPCHCAIASDDPAPRKYGYWRLLPASTLAIYGEFDFGFTGPKLLVPVLPGDVEPLTGIWRYTLLITP